MNSLTGWAKWREDLSSTKTQAALLAVLMIVGATIKGLWLATTTADVAALFSAAWPAWSALLAMWSVAKVTEIRTAAGVTEVKSAPEQPKTGP